MVHGQENFIMYFPKEQSPEAIFADSGSGIYIMQHEKKLVSIY